MQVGGDLHVLFFKFHHVFMVNKVFAFGFFFILLLLLFKKQAR